MAWPLPAFISRLVSGAASAVSYIFTERADHAETPTAGKAELWVRDDTPTSLVYTDDAGTDVPIVVNGVLHLAATMTTRGDLLYVDSGGSVTRLPVGTNGQVVTTDGTDVSWGTVAGGGGAELTDIALQVVGRLGAYWNNAALDGYGTIYQATIADSANAGAADAGGWYWQQSTSSSSGNIAKYYGNAAFFAVAGRYALVGRIAIVDTASVRHLWGLSSNAALGADDTPGTSYSVAIIRASTEASDSNFQFLTGTGSAQTVTDTGVTFEAGTFDVYIQNVDGGTTWRWGIAKLGSAWTTGTVTTNVPIAAMTHTHTLTTLTDSAKSWRLYTMAHIDLSAHQGDPA